MPRPAPKGSPSPIGQGYVGVWSDMIGRLNNQVKKLSGLDLMTLLTLGSISVLVWGWGFLMGFYLFGPVLVSVIDP